MSSEKAIAKNISDREGCQAYAACSIVATDNTASPLLPLIVASNTGIINSPLEQGSGDLATSGRAVNEKHIRTSRA